MEMILNDEKSKTILLEEIQLCDVLIMADTMVSVCDMGDEEGERISIHELKDNISTHWKKGNLAVLSNYDYEEGYLQFTIYNKKGLVVNDLEIYIEEDTDIYSTFGEYFVMDHYMGTIKYRRKQK